MHKQAEELLEKVNEKLKSSPLIYFSRDIERALGLENYIKNYHIACIEPNYVYDQLKKKRKSLFQLEEDILKHSTLELVSNSRTHEWIKKIAGENQFYAQFFQFNQPAIREIETLNGVVLNNQSTLNRTFEGKISQYTILKNNGAQVPRGAILELEEQTYEEIVEKVGSPEFVVQMDMAHTGSGTYFIKNAIDWDVTRSTLQGNQVKITELIHGNPYTLNACVTKKGVFVAGFQYQITGIPELTKSEGSTVGNDWSFGSKRLQDKDFMNKVLEVTTKVGEAMQNSGYRGLFGLDLVEKDSEIYVIEINARQTANIPMQTKLEILQDRIPLALINLAEWLDIEIPFEPWEEILSLEGSQIFLRARVDNFEINSNIKSGVYRLQSDNAALLTPAENKIVMDEDGDKPLIWQGDGYSVEDLGEGGFILLMQKKDLVKNIYDEIARMQFSNGIVQNNFQIAPWIIEAMKEIEARVR